MFYNKADLPERCSPDDDDKIIFDKGEIVRNGAELRRRGKAL
jgi:hypothetical protein